MNRQARLAGTDYPWHDYGALTFEEAAKRYAFGGWHGTLEVRDESEPEIVHTLTVERVVEYRVTNLRGGE